MAGGTIIWRRVPTSAADQSAGTVVAGGAGVMHLGIKRIDQSGSMTGITTGGNLDRQAMIGRWWMNREEIRAMTGDAVSRTCGDRVNDLRPSAFMTGSAVAQMNDPHNFRLRMAVIAGCRGGYGKAVIMPRVFESLG